MLPATTSNNVRLMRGYDPYAGVPAEVRAYVQREWNGNGTDVLVQMTRAGRAMPVRRRPREDGWFRRLVQGLSALVTPASAGRA